MTADSVIKKETLGENPNEDQTASRSALLSLELESGLCCTESFYVQP